MFYFSFILHVRVSKIKLKQICFSFQDGGGRRVGSLLSGSVLVTAVVPNFDKISQSTTEIILLPVFEYKRRHIEILLSVSILAYR